MRLLVKRPRRLAGPLDWVASVLLDRPPAIAWYSEDGPDGETTIWADDRSIHFPALFPPPGSPATNALPKPPFKSFGLNSHGHGFVGDCSELMRTTLPVLLGEPTLRCDRNRVWVGADILGTAFLLLSAYEEACPGPRDAHDRFEGCTSLLARGGLIERPLVDEYAAFLRTCLTALLPGKIPCSRAAPPTVCVSCDVDHPFDPAARGLLPTIRSLGGDLISRRSPILASTRVANLLASRFGVTALDPFNTFEWYMDECERAGLTVTFYFLAGRTTGVPDGSYDISDPRVNALLRRIHSRGHLIGMHGSYMSYCSEALLNAERNRLAESLSRAGVDTPVISNRQHYLRWDPLTTPDYLDSAGFTEDSTGGFADLPGFRFGTAHPFPMWSWRRRSPLRLLQRPLLVMEQSLLKGGSSSSRVLALLSACKRLRSSMAQTGGAFHLLWHNSTLVSRCQRHAFCEAIQP